MDTVFMATISSCTSPEVSKIVMTILGSQRRSYVLTEIRNVWECGCGLATAGKMLQGMTQALSECGSVVLLLNHISHLVITCVYYSTLETMD